MREWLKREPLPAAADDAPAARFFTVSMLVMYGCLLWILPIYLSDKYKRFK